jgi:hypothetical protein
MPASAYVEGAAADEAADTSAGSLEFLRWKDAQIAVMRRPACAALAIICMLPVPFYYAVAGSNGTAFERFVGYTSLGHRASLGLCTAQTALFLLLAILPPFCSSPSRLRLQQLLLASLVAICLLSSAILCPSCILSFTASPPAHGVAHPAMLFAITCFLLDTSLLPALPAAAAILVANACFIAYAPRDADVYLNFMCPHPRPRANFIPHRVNRSPLSRVIVIFCSTLIPASHALLFHVGSFARRRGAFTGAVCSAFARVTPTLPTLAPATVLALRRAVAPQVPHTISWLRF